MEFSGMEMVAVLLIALLVLGPEEMIKHSVKMGRFVAKMRNQFETYKKMVQAEINRGADAQDMAALKDLKKQVDSLGTDLKGKLEHIAKPRLDILANFPVKLSEAEIEENLLNIGSKE